MTPTLLVVAGEASGDLHGANLVRALKARRPDLRVLAAGGPRLQAAGAELVADLVTHAVVGLAEVATKLATFTALFRKLVSVVRRSRPAAVVLIDFPDFNMRLGRQAREEGVPVVYYISPQVWAWRPGRVRTLARMVRKMLVIFAFEEALYRERGVDVEYVGHPLLDAMPGAIDGAALRRELGLGANDALIGLLPGSRASVVRRHAPVLRGAIDVIRERLPSARFAVAAGGAVEAGAYRRFRDVCPIVYGRTYEVVRAADLVITASGTATVEAAILGTPMLVMYKVHPITAALLAPLVKVKRFAMVNILAGRDVAPEFMQRRATPERIGRAAVEALERGRLSAMRRDLDDVRAKLGGPGASARAAEAVLRVIGEN